MCSKMLAFLHVFLIVVHFHRALGNPRFNEPVFTPTAHGPQSAEAAEIARNALQGNHFGGDILFGFGRAGYKPEEFRWPGYPGGGVVPYIIREDLDNDDFKNNLEKAIQAFAENTCITIVPRTNEEDYINFINGAGGGCYSYIGNQRDGEQVISIGDGCNYVGTIIHEIGHAIGLFHEHQRSDRDDYITIDYSHAYTWARDQLTKTNPQEELILSPYNYDSIMHYGNYAFSYRPGVFRTIEAKTGQNITEAYEKSGLADTDIEQINKLYKC